MQFQEIIALPSREKNCTCSMSCAGNATFSDKLPKYCKLLIFWQFICQEILPSHCVAGFAIFAIALRSRVKNCSCSLSLSPFSMVLKAVSKIAPCIHQKCRICSRFDIRNLDLTQISIQKFGFCLRLDGRKLARYQNLIY